MVHFYLTAYSNLMLHYTQKNPTVVQPNIKRDGMTDTWDFLGERDWCVSTRKALWSMQGREGHSHERRRMNTLAVFTHGDWLVAAQIGPLHS